MAEPSTYGGEQYCLEQLSRFDRDRYLSVLVAPARDRPVLAILAAFNLELAQVSESVSEHMLGLIRLQWWRDAVGEIAAGGAVRRHGVTTPLTEAVRGHRLPVARLEAMIAARERDIDPDPNLDLAGVEAYLDATAGNLVRLSLQALSGERGGGEQGGGEQGRDPADERMDAMARHAGIAYGLTGLIRATLFQAQYRRLLLPQDVMRRHGVDLDLLFDLKPQPALAKAVEELVRIAGDHLAALRSLRPSRRVVPALLTARLAGLQLERLRRGGYDLFVYENIDNRPSDIWRLLAARLMGRV